MAESLAARVMLSRGTSSCYTVIISIFVDSNYRFGRNSVGDNCDVAVTNNAGCGVKVSQANSYGPEFNANGGGWCVGCLKFVDGLG